MKTTLNMIYLGLFRNINQVENLYIILSSSAKKGLSKLNKEIKPSSEFLLKIQ
jgi:hypothetical protein